jgi:hypothetical protein
MFATETISPVSTFSVYTSRKSDNLDATPINSDQNSAVTPLVAKLIDRNCKGGEAATIINDLSAEKLLEVMDYWWKNNGF